MHDYRQKPTNAAVKVSSADTRTLVYECPNGHSASIVSILISNTDNTTSDIEVTLEVYDNDQGSYAMIGNDLLAIYGSTLHFDRPVNLQQADQLLITSPVADAIEVFCSVIETKEFHF